MSDPYSIDEGGWMTSDQLPEGWRFKAEPLGRALGVVAWNGKSAADCRRTAVRAASAQDAFAPLSALISEIAA